jgi:hypothetical protein
MIAALLVLAQEPTVTLRLDGAHSSTVLAAIAKQAGTPMRPAGEVANDFLAVHLDQVPLSEAMRLLATVLDAEWVQREEALYLERGVKQHLRMKKEEDEGLRKSIAAFLEKNAETALDKEAVRKAFIDLTDPKRTQSSQQEAMTVLQRFRPESRFGARVVRSLGTELLVSVQEEKPLRMVQLADGTGNMGTGVKSALKTMLREQEEFDQLALSLGSQGFFGGSTPVGHLVDYAVQVARNRGSVRVTLQRRAVQAGQVTANYSSEIATFGGRANNGLPGRRPNAPGPERTFEIPTLAKSVTKCVLNDPTRTDSDQTAALEMFKNLAANEPLAVYGSLPLAQSLKDSNYIVLLPDSLLPNPNWARSTSLSQVWNAWSSGFMMGEDPKSKVVLARPSNPYWARDTRFDRHAIARLASEIDRNKRPTLDSLGAFALVMADSREYVNNYRYSMSVLHLPQEVPDFIALKAWGSLSSSQKRSAHNGGVVVPMKNLPNSVREMFETNLTTESATFADRPTERVIWTANGRNYNGRTSNGALFVAGALPASSEVKFVVHHAMLFRAAPSGRNQGANQLYSAQEIADLSRQQSNEWNPDYKNAAVVNAERLQVEVFVPGAGYSHYVAQLDDSGQNTKFLPLAQLPEPFRSQVSAALARRGG